MTVMGDEALVGRLLDGRYRVGQLIARGGMASVFVGTDERLDRQIAIKVMHRGLGDPAAFTERFKREAKAAAKLNHSNVVSVFDQGNDGDAIYLVMEYVPGHTLRDVMKREAPMSAQRAIEIVEPVLVALAAAHRANLIHRDVKPENVLITPDGAVKVADFGLARAVSSATTATSNTLIGTVSYLAPEIVSHTGSDARSDVYAVGAMLYEMLTGQKPHAGESPIQIAYKHVHEDIAAPSAQQPAIPPYVDALVARATVRDRSQRAADAHVLLQYVHLVQDALARGLVDDPELTEHLTPTPGDEPAGTAPRTAVSTGLPLHTSDGAEPTVQWSFDSTPPDRGFEASGPGSTVPAGGRATRDGGTARDGSWLARLATPSRGKTLLIIVLIAALLAVVLGYWLAAGRYVQAPALVGMPESQATETAEQAGFEFTVADRQFSETEPIGEVLSTNPKAGASILPGGTIEAVVSNGKERYQVPDLAGESLDEATNLLHDVNLELGTVTKAWSTKVKKDHVIRLNGLHVGQSVKKSTVVSLFVSKGPEPVDIPNVVGADVATAVATLKVAGLKVTVTQRYDDLVPQNAVIEQVPGPGPAHRGDEITLTVSKGRKIHKIPNVVGMTVKQAENTLRDSGYEPIHGRNMKKFTTVNAQAPAAGTEAPPGSPVALF